MPAFSPLSLEAAYFGNIGVVFRFNLVPSSRSIDIYVQMEALIVELSVQILKRMLSRCTNDLLPGDRNKTGDDTEISGACNSCQQVEHSWH